MRRNGSLIIILLLAFPFSAAADFALRDGDTVVFLGDSITAERGYGKVIENYTLLRYPQRRVRFINAGWGGDTAAGGLQRLERDVFARGATVLIVAYGINDIGWGLKADAEHRQRYLDSIREIVRCCKERNVRVFICSAAITAENPDTAENGFLTKMCDDGMAIARAAGEGAIDVQRGMREIQRRVLAANARAKDEKDKTSLHTADGIHLNDLGQIAMGFVLLKGLGAPADVSAATIDARAATVVEQEGCRIDELECADGRVAFTRLDEGLPLNFGPLGALNFRFIPIPDQLNRHMLTVRNLEPGKYNLTVDGRAVGTWTHEQLATGVNISSATPNGWEPGGPWDAQAALLKMITQSRNELAQMQKTAVYYFGPQIATQPAGLQADAINADLERLQRETARPRPYRFVLERAGKDR
ncbi:MAG TPA: SGNH/GDSL hydrolase family protein [Phycisphaerae bacterium]|nr:SGNH/GDSL hydrolase family protein [Phycisphaerae bacterium]